MLGTTDRISSVGAGIAFAYGNPAGAYSTMLVVRKGDVLYVEANGTGYRYMGFIPAT